MSLLGNNYTLSSCWQKAEKPSSSSSYNPIQEEKGKKIVPNASDHEKGSKVNTNSDSSEKMIEKALETVGSKYVYHGYVWTGDPSTSQFTCSGLVDYALGRPSQTDSPETLRDEIGIENITTDISKLKRGDIVFYQFYGEGHTDGWGHVGIYLGDGQIVHAFPGGVQIDTVDNPSIGKFLGGGTIT